MIQNFQSAGNLTVTLNTTEDCNLRCKYCYEINKKCHSLEFDKAKKFIDLILEDPDPTASRNDVNIVYRTAYTKGITFDFIGGDSFMDVDLLDKIFTYIYKRIYTEDLPNNKYYRGHLVFSVCSNGTLFESKKVRDFCEKWAGMLLVNVSIDGCPEIHDMNRVYPDGHGSMSTIMKWWPWYRKTFPEDSLQTKATCARNTIPYLYDSLVFMHETLGLRYINQNFIMEDTGCTEEDYKLLDEQLGKCVDYVLDHCDELYWSMISYEQFALAHHSTGDDWFNDGHCGSGAMPALGINGEIYPCFRWLPQSQSHELDRETFSVGNINDGLNRKENFLKVRQGAYRCNCTKDEKCLTCPIESACSYCIAGCYCEFGEFKRTTYICEITKLQVKWARNYWDRYNALKGLPPNDWEQAQKITRHGDYHK